MAERKDIHSSEIAEGKRFEFGKNWKRFLTVLNDDRIASAELSLKQMLEIEDLKDKRFLDVGSGSGLFSLAARRLGAKVFSLDYDPQSVACTSELRSRYFPKDENWIIEEGSVLDLGYIQSLGKFDIVYSWGVLHHTGNLWKALNNVQYPVENDGILFIGLYNDEGFMSEVWKKIKRIYCSGTFGKVVIFGIYFPYFFFKRSIADILRLRNPLDRYATYKRKRGMSALYDVIDWLGGYPYEVASNGSIFDFYRKNKFQLMKLKTGCGHSINEFVLKKTG